MKVDPQTLAAYAGKYQLAPNVFVTITKEGDRFYVIAPPGEQRVELFAESETKFVALEFDGHIAFIRNEKGEVTELTAEIGGRSYRARKI
jgi:D-alanyl-D-alanine-carboxypeptidase/D-alanyl-D-alanine-endopeptidase